MTPSWFGYDQTGVGNCFDDSGENGRITAVRVAALYDIHGNLPALEAAIEDVRGARVDAVIVGGDVLPGPMPREPFSHLQNGKHSGERERSLATRIIFIGQYVGLDDVDFCAHYHHTSV